MKDARHQSLAVRGIQPPKPEKQTGITHGQLQPCGLEQGQDRATNEGNAWTTYL